MSHATVKIEDHAFQAGNPQGTIDTQIRISSGALVDLANFKPDDVCRFSISRSLNNLKRFTGHWRDNPPLTVAQHTILCEEIAKLEFKPELTIDNCYDYDDKYYNISVGCRIHDWPEAYYTDLSSPMKRFLGEAYREKIKEIDTTVYKVAWEGFYTLDGSFNDVKEEVKHCDHLSLRIEQHMMFGTRPPEEWVREFMIKHDTRKMFLQALALQEIRL